MFARAVAIVLGAFLIAAGIYLAIHREHFRLMLTLFALGSLGPIYGVIGRLPAWTRPITSALGVDPEDRPNPRAISPIIWVPVLLVMLGGFAVWMFWMN